MTTANHDPSKPTAIDQTPADDAELIALCQEWARLDAEVNAAFADTDDDDLHSAVLKRYSTVFARVTYMAPATLSGLLAKIAVVRTEWATSHGSADGSVFGGDTLDEAVYAVLCNAERFAVIQADETATAAAIVPASVENDPAVIIGRQYFDALDRARTACVAWDSRWSEAHKFLPKPPAELMVTGHPFTDGKPHLVFEEYIDYHFPPQQHKTIRRLFAEHKAACDAVYARFGIPDMEAEKERLEKVQSELFGRLAQSRAATVAGLVFKLRAFREESDEEPMINTTLSDAECLAGLSPAS